MQAKSNSSHANQSVAARRLRAHARLLRKLATPSERALWEHIRAGRLGVLFRRQQIVGASIVDFLAPKLKIVVEVDGGYHGRPEVAAADARRAARLRHWGYRVVRLPAELVLEQPAAAVGKIAAAIEAAAG